MALIPLLGGNLASTGFDPTLIGNSVWFDGSADYMDKTFSSGSAQSRIVYACWLQRNDFSRLQSIFTADKSGRADRFGFQADDTIDIHLEQNGGSTIIYSTSNVFRDTGWYHFILSIDLNVAQASAVQLYVNGVQNNVTVTFGPSAGALSTMDSFGNAARHAIGKRSAASDRFSNTYQTQCTLLVGQSIQNGDVSVSDFVDTFTFGTNGSQYVPKADADIVALATTAGGNSFCLDFSTASVALSSGVTPTSNAGTFSGSLSNLTDGNFTTDWRSTVDPATSVSNDYVAFDLGSAKDVKAVKITGRSSTTGNFKVQFSDNGSDFTDTGTTFSNVSITTTANSGILDLTSDNPGSHRYWKLINISNSSGTSAWGFQQIILDSAVGNLGTDASGNGNDFTLNSMSSTNQTINTPSKYYPKVSNIGIPSGDTAANYTMGRGSSRMVYSGADQGYKGLISTQIIQPDDSPIYWEYYLESGSVGGASGGRVGVGLCVPHFNVGIGAFSGAGGNNPSNLRGVIYDNGSQGATTGSTLIGVGDIQNLAYEPSTGKIWFGVNGTWNNGSEAASTTLNPSGHDYQATVQDYVFFISASRSTDIGVLNFGDNPSMSGNITAGTETDANGHGLFKYAVPSGFFAPVSANLTASDYQGIDYFNAVLVTGDATNDRAITGMGFASDLLVYKKRSAALSWKVQDVIRGVNNVIYFDATNAEQVETGFDTINDADGFTINNASNANDSGATYVAYGWLAGGAGSSNTDGSITSTVTVANAGHLSIGTYTGTGANATIGHGLTAAPEFVNVKQLNSTASWSALIPALGNSNAIFLNLSNAAQSVGTAYWQNTDPTSSVFSIGTDNGVNASSSTYLFQCFRSVPGVCKVGSYIGNGNADGPYVSVGFSPKWVMVKPFNAANPWTITDTSRDPINATTRRLHPNLSQAEAADSLTCGDILADGFKLRASHGNVNQSGITYLYLAMADLAGNGTLPPLYGR